MSVFEPGRRAHVIGVAGAGMSGLALLLQEKGLLVSGSDAADSVVLEELRARGIEVSVGHQARHVEGADLVLWSPAVATDNSELVAARASGATLVPRARALAELSLERRLIGLSGTHGKTTATSMMVQVALAAGRDDGWLLGAPVLGVGANGHWGGADLVVEVDESYGTFAEVSPYALGVLNVEADHLDHYGSLDALEAAFVGLMNRTHGAVVAWGDDPGAARVSAASRSHVAMVGVDAAYRWRVENAWFDRRGASFVLRGPGEPLEISLRVTGAHNVANAAVVAALASELEINGDAVERGLSNFLGAPRRFQFRGSWRGCDVYEDYAHLPGEIRATIRTARALDYERVGVVFQPHRVSRTRALVDQFATAFSGSSRVIVTDLYLAGEANPEGLHGELVASAIARADDSVEVTYCESLDGVPGALDAVVGDLDVILVLGAGDVGQVIAALPGGLS